MPVDKKSKNSSIIKVLIACASPITKQGLVDSLKSKGEFHILEKKARFEHTSEFKNTVVLLQKEKPDIVLVCFQMIVRARPEDIHNLKKRVDSVKIAIFNSELSRRHEVEFLKYGVSGVFNKRSTPENFAEGLKKIYKGQTWISLAGTSRQKQEGITTEEKLALTKRQIEVLSLLSLGLKNREIAEKLFISPGTVKCHINNIYNILGVKDRFTATFYAVRWGLNKTS